MRSYAETLAERNPQDPCPTCEQVGGYCGGENHPSCGLFAEGRPVAAKKKCTERLTTLN